MPGCPVLYCSLISLVLPTLLFILCVSISVQGRHGLEFVANLIAEEHSESSATHEHNS